jgi:transcription-repair coupling factor (superfamily II helicase)
MKDPIVDEVRRVREELIQRYGGIDGYFKHLQAMDRARLFKAKQKRQRTAAKTTSKKISAG